ncbi:MAG: GTPase ObgE [Porphyromonas sp.]|nr:GTPase ObgE [Porphyromonas sp.]
MSESNFVDYVKIYCRSGKGGPGSRHFRRERSNPKGGPDGGNGGRGGDIYVRGNQNHWTLLHLRYDRHIMATHGEAGGANNKSGKDGTDVYIEVPLGTVLHDADTGDFICEVKEHGETHKILQGGRGGLGNTNFATPTDRAPRYAQPGEPYQERNIVMQLKMLADVGLVGFPNAGKSTLLSAVSEAKPKIADYPFTTLEPNLGIVNYRDNHSFVLADIPGIIEGASEGRGLGLRFLRHIERNSVLLFVVPADAEDIGAEYATLLGELEKYNPELMEKNRLLGISKSDLIDDDIREMLLPTIPEEVEHCFFSAVTGEGVTQLKDAIWRSLTIDNFHDVSPIVQRNIHEDFGGGILEEE